MSWFGSGILNGLRITMRNMRRGPITVQYPKERIELPERARWAVQMKLDDEGAHKCTACLACQKACPDYVIDIDVTTAEDRTKHINTWQYEIGACMMCGLCVEACPFDAIEMGHDYELARTDPDTLTIKLLEDTPTAKPKRKGDEPGADKPKAAAERPEPAAESTEAAGEPAPAAGEPEAAAEPAGDSSAGTSEDQTDTGRDAE